MSHDLFRNTMAYVGETPWHGLGKKIPSATTASSFLEAASLDWQVRLDPAAGAKLDKRGRWNRLIISRDPLPPEQAPVALGMVTHRYHPLQNTEAFAFFDPLIQSGWASYEAAGALGDGETVWVQVRLRKDMEIREGDRICRYLLLRNRHNGEGSVSVRFTPVRVVCQNTLSFAERKTPTFANIRHSKSMASRLLEVQADALQKEIEAFSERAGRVFAAMAKKQLGAEQRLDLLDKLCGEPPKGQPVDGIPARRTLVDQRLKDQGNTDPLAGTGTIWALYNAITWAEDERARLRGKKNPEAGLNTMWFGSGADNKAKAYDTLSALVPTP